MRAERELRRRCRRLLNELDIRPPLDVATLCQKIGEQRGRPICLVAHPIPVPGPFGAWIATAGADYILYQQDTTKAHQDHIVMHELGHLLAGHHGGEQDAGVSLQLNSLDGNSTSEAIHRILHRTSYDTADEREAELVATIILEWASVLDRLPPQVASDAAVQRIGTSLNDRLGWL